MPNSEFFESFSERHNIAERAAETGDATRAFWLFERLLADRTRILGPDHQDTVATAERLRTLSDETESERNGLLDPALRMFQRIQSDPDRFEMIIEVPADQDEYHAKYGYLPSSESASPDDAAHLYDRVTTEDVVLSGSGATIRGSKREAPDVSYWRSDELVSNELAYNFLSERLATYSSDGWWPIVDFQDENFGDFYFHERGNHFDVPAPNAFAGSSWTTSLEEVRQTFATRGRHEKFRLNLAKTYSPMSLLACFHSSLRSDSIATLTKAAAGPVVYWGDEFEIDFPDAAFERDMGQMMAVVGDTMAGADWGSRSVCVQWT